MRTAFVESLIETAKDDDRVWLLTGDLGFGVLEPFAEKFPDRFVNVGVAEQNMVGMAAGLALSGKIVFVYSIANFPVMRCLEQIRNDIAYHRLNVKVVSVGGGFSYGMQGYTHYAIEDLAVMGALPNMNIAVPGDPVETRALVPQIKAMDGPGYLRLGRAGEHVIHSEMELDRIKLGEAVLTRFGHDVTLISIGSMLKVCVDVADCLKKEGYSIRVISMHAYQPLDCKSVITAAKETRALVTVEEHMSKGGLGTMVADIMMENSLFVPLHKIGVSAESFKQVGSQSYMRQKMGCVEEAVRKLLVVFEKRDLLEDSLSR